MTARRGINCITALVFTLILAGCGGSSQSAAVTGGGTTYDSASSFGIAAGNSYAPAMAPEPEEAKEEYASPTEADVIASQEKLVYTGYMTIETLTYTETVQNVRQYISQYKGIIEHEDEYDDDYYWYSSTSTKRATKYMNLTVRIPTESFSAFMESMEGTGKVRSRSTNVANITQAYNDASARIESLETQQRRLLDMMDKAETIEDMIAIEARLSEVETDLKREETNRRRMDTDVAYSTITLDIREVMEYSPEVSNVSFLQRIRNTWTSAWKGFAEFLEDLVLAAIRLLPYLLIIIPLGYLFLRWRKAVKAAHPEREHRSFFRRKKKNPADEVQNTEHTEQ